MPEPPAPSNSQRNSLPDPPSNSLLLRWLPTIAVLWLCVFWVMFFSARLPNASNAERTLYRFDIIRVLPEILAGLVESDPRTAATSGWKFLPQRTDIFLAGLLIIGGALSAGRLLLAGTGQLSQLDRPSAWGLAGGLGMGVLSLFTLTCGMAGILSRPIFLLVLSVLLIVEALRTYRQFRAEARTPTVPRRTGSRLIPAICLIVCAAFFLIMMLGAMLPPWDFDVKEYHLGGPKEYFLAGRVHFLPHNVYTSFPFLTEMLLLCGMVVQGDWERGALVGQLVLCAFAPITACGVAGVARLLSGRTAAWLGAMIYMSIPWTYRISIIAYTEGALCCYVVLTLLACFQWRTQVQAGAAARSRLWIVGITGFLAGCAAATKYPGLVMVVVPFSLVVFWFAMRDWRHGLGQPAIPCLAFGFGVLLAFGPWMLKNLLETGNPFYPLLYSLFGGVDWNDQLQAKFKNGHPSKLLSPGWNDLKGVFYENDWQSPLLFGFAPLALLQPRRRTIGLVIGYAGVLLAAWYLLTHRIDRFWVPMNSVMSVLAACGLAAMLGLQNIPVSTEPKAPAKRKAAKPVTPHSSQRIPISIPAIAVTGLTGFALLYNFAFATTPLCGFNGYLLSEAEARRQVQTASVRVIDSLQLPAGSKILFVGEAALFDSRLPYAYSTVFDNNLLEEWTSEREPDGHWKLLPTATILQKLHEEGITHVLVDWNEILRYRTTYGFTDFVTPERLQELVAAQVLRPITLPESVALRNWEDVDGTWKQEIERRIPGLKTLVNGSPAMIQFQAFQVVESIPESN